MRITTNEVAAAVLGGAVLGGGGGGAMANGRTLGERALRTGEVELLDIGDLPGDAVLVTCSYVGSPAAEHLCVHPEAYVRALELLSRDAALTIAGLISNECGGTGATNGWLQAATLGLPVVDAPCNGRAHPTGMMGSMGLHALAGYISQQAAAGGDAGAGRYVEMSAKGSLDSTSALVRQAAVEAGGMVAVARNPVEASYVRTHAAPGAIRLCIDLGRGMLAAHARGGEEVCQVAAEKLGGEILAIEEVEKVQLLCAGGFDAGSVQLEAYMLDFWNEYMTLERAGERLATFPDLIMTLDARDGMPVTTAEIKAGRRVAVLVVPRGKLILGAGMYHEELYAPVEKALGKSL